MQITIEKIERETDKALLIAVGTENAAQRIGRKVWFPKSQIQINGNVLECPDWLADKKLEEIMGGRNLGVWFT